MESTNFFCLVKDSNESEIRMYFEKVLQLKQSDEKFPVNLDEVWPLVYSEKGVAIRSLKKSFIENVDFVSFDRNVKREIGSSKFIEYKLSISCLEYFIARKVRPVFEVYRKVFHKVAEQKELLSPAEMFLQNAKMMVEHERRLKSVETKVDSIIQRQEEAENELKALPISTEPVPEMSERDELRLLVNRYVQATGINHKVVWDNIYQQMYYKYHISIKGCKKKPGETWLDVAERKNYISKMKHIISGLISEQEKKKLVTV